MWFFLGLGVLLVLWQLRRPRPGAKTADAGGLLGRAVLERPPATPAAFDEDADHARESEDSGEDADDIWSAVAAEPVRCSIDVYLTYRDGSGRETRRRVTVREFDYAAPRYLFCFCHLRQNTRTFYMSRILQAVDPETGEVLDSLHEFLRARYEASPEFSLDLLFAAQRNAMRVLLYVGKADGRLMQAERAIIHRVARALSSDDQLTERQIDSVLNEFTAPSKAVFQKAIRTMAKQETLDRRIIVLRAAEDMVATQGKVHADEAYALAYMRPRLTAPDIATGSTELDWLPSYGKTLAERQREAAVLLQERKEEWKRAQERDVAEAAAESFLSPRCSVCFHITGARLPLPPRSPLGATAQCDRCGFTQVLTESGAERPGKFLIQYVYQGRPLPEGVPAPYELPRGDYGELRGKLAQRYDETEAQLQALIEGFSRRTIAEPEYSAAKARVIESGEADVRAIHEQMQREYNVLWVEKDVVRQRLKQEMLDAGRRGKTQ